MTAFEQYFVEMMKNPPDPNEPKPLSNRPATMYGATLPFHILAWAAVLFRLWTRFRVVRDAGWDDYIIALTAVVNGVSMVGFVGSINTGLGEHILYVGSGRLLQMLKYLYIGIAGYYMCAGLVKLSLLVQYLRIFKTGALRTTCLALIYITGAWTLFWTIQGWFPCWPVSGMWNRLQTPKPKCWGTGFEDKTGAMVSLYAFAISNMVLDSIIFAIPMVVYLRPGIGRRQIVALGSLFTLGSIVVLMSILRLWTTFRHKMDDPRVMDFTWWYPTPLTIACVEIDFAIICASIPIFWPVIVASLPQIFVTQEVHVTHHQRLDDFEMDRPTSLKSHNSQEGLTRGLETKTNYSDRYVVDHVTGKQNTQVVVGTDTDHNKWFR